MKKLLVACFLFLAGITLHADPPAASDYYDSLPVTERNFNEEQLSSHRDDPDFDYTRTSIERPSYFDRFIRWLLEKTLDRAAPADVTNTMEAMMWILMAAALILVIYFGIKAEGTFFFGKRAPEHTQVQFLDFQGEESQLDEQLLLAEANGNYPLALRFLFIKTLHVLEQAGLLDWKKEKTNGDYLRELKGELHRTPFERLSHLFEFVHYGQHSMDENDYTEAKSLFARLRKSMKGGANEA